MKLSKNKSSNQVRITVSVPKSYVELMDLLVDQKLYHSRGEIVQTALRDLLIREAGLNGEGIIRLKKSITSH
ncbi:MAG: ribbon-helix-helix domain-containing protein [Nitrososphaerota archaeon]